MKPLLLIGPPDASLALAAAVIQAQECAAPVPPGRLLTALAHAGIEANVDKAPYDHILAGPAQRLFLEGVEGGLDAWPAACRAYLERLLAAAAETSDAPYLLETAPEYARLWPFIERVLPDVTPIVLLRNPVGSAAVVLGGETDPRAGHHWLEAMRQLAALIRAREGSVPVIRHEQLLIAPEAELAALERCFGGSWTAPTDITADLDAASMGERAWRAHLAQDRALFGRVRALIERLGSKDLEALGYSWAAAWEPVEAALGHAVKPRPVRMRWHAAVRSVRARAARFVAARPRAAAKVRRLKLACEVLLRE